MNAWAINFDDAVDYEQASSLQKHLVAARLANEIPDTVLFLQHKPVVTLGRRGRDNHLLVSKDVLASKGINLVTSIRGGDVTYHAPGQLIIYPILKLGEYEEDAHGYLYNLEETAIRTAAEFGVKAFRREGLNGAWTTSGKLAAIGFKLRHWVTSHGMSFNIDMDMSGFKHIKPCGLGDPVISLKEILGNECPAIQTVRSVMKSNFSDVFGRNFNS